MTNTPLENYLNYYKKCSDPGYAVLVTGEWGSGKTHQVKNALQPDEYYYVSLFGLQTTSEVNFAVLAAMNPQKTKAKNIFEGAGQTSKDIGGFFALGGLAPRLAELVLSYKVKRDRILIFDDLERSSLLLKDRLGVINKYVEHHRCRVVVIAHDDKIIGQFQQSKEKLFGQHIRITPQTLAAFSRFCELQKDKGSYAFIEKYTAEILETFEASSVSSLRILKHLLEDLSRLYDGLEGAHLSNSTAMSELVRLFSALNIEFRAGNLSREDLRDRGGAIHAYRLKSFRNQGPAPDRPNILVANEKYAAIKLDDNLLTDSALVSMLIEGHYDQDLVCTSLNESHHFLTIEDMPPWRVIISFDDLEDDDVENALNSMQKQFHARSVTEPGEMLHIFSLRLMLAENNAIKAQLHDVAAECKEYIDDLLEKGVLPPEDVHSAQESRLNRAHAHVAYWITESTEEHFQGIYEHLAQARQKAFNKNIPKLTSALLDLMKADGAAFREKIARTNRGDNPYALVPILAHIPPKEFVSAWLSSPKENWKMISMGLADRYNGPWLGKELISEKNWARSVADLLNAEAANCSGLKALRITRAIPSEMRDM